MSSSTMTIPKTITVGYNKRKDTYTGKLAYVIYTDNKGKLRKETSWQNWRSKKLGRDDFNNVPTSGFVLNKGVGGTRNSYGWNARNEYIRVYDPRNFEFEISVSNLLFILQESSSIKGKGLEGEFIYSWDGTELVLLPVNSQEYKDCVTWNERQKIKFDKKDMKEGRTYLMKDNTEVMYLGRHFFNKNSYYKDDAFLPAGKKHIFVTLEKQKYISQYIVQPGFTKIAECISFDTSPQFLDKYDEFVKSKHYGNIKEIKIIKTAFSNDRYYQQPVLLIEQDKKYYPVTISANYSHGYPYYNNYSKRNYVYFAQSNEHFNKEIKKGKVEIPNVSSNPVPILESEVLKKQFYTINVVTEGGKELKVYK